MEIIKMVEKEILKVVKCPWALSEDRNEQSKSPVPMKAIFIKNTTEHQYYHQKSYL